LERVHETLGNVPSVPRFPQVSQVSGPRQKFWQERYYDSNVHGAKARFEVIRYIHRNPVMRGLVEKTEDWPWSSFRHYATGVVGVVEIESRWTAARRGNQLPEGVRLREGELLCFATQAAKDAAWMGHNPSRENQK
jgi:hypothetical protein